MKKSLLAQIGQYKMYKNDKSFFVVLGKTVEQSRIVADSFLRIFAMQ